MSIRYNNGYSFKYILCRYIYIQKKETSLKKKIIFSCLLHETMTQKHVYLNCFELLICWFFPISSASFYLSEAKRIENRFNSIIVLIFLLLFLCVVYALSHRYKIDVRFVQVEQSHLIFFFSTKIDKKKLIYNKNPIRTYTTNQ